VSTIILDTLEFATKLKAGGFTEQQAETQARAIAEIVEKQLATKRDTSFPRSAWECLLRRSASRNCFRPHSGYGCIPMPSVGAMNREVFQ
jgi:hypothetical protein